MNILCDCSQEMAYEKNQKYKEGKSVLERSVPCHILHLFRFEYVKSTTHYSLMFFLKSHFTPFLLHKVVKMQLFSGMKWLQDFEMRIFD